MSVFKTSLKKVYPYLAFIGLSPDPGDNVKSMLKRIQERHVFIMHIVPFKVLFVSQIAWLIQALLIGDSLLEVTFLLPCLTLCLLSAVKVFTFLYFAPDVNDIIDSLDILQTDLVSSDEERNAFLKKSMGYNIKILESIRSKLKILIIAGIITFSINPLIIIWLNYKETGEVKLELPFIAAYPFNKFDMKYYPFVYIHQIFTGVQACSFVYGPDCYFFTCATFIHIYFLALQFDMEHLDCDNLEYNSDIVKSNIRKLIIRHIELIRCVDVMDKIFSKPIFTNASISSLIICVTGFNVMFIDSIIYVISFGIFLVFGLLQIFLYCYYGDNIMRASMQIGDAIYNSKWYNVKGADRKELFIILIRSQRPCKFTACGFFNINLAAFTSVLSTSWSYFALLRTMID